MTPILRHIERLTKLLQLNRVFTVWGKGMRSEEEIVKNLKAKIDILESWFQDIQNLRHVGEEPVGVEPTWNDEFRSNCGR